MFKKTDTFIFLLKTFQWFPVSESMAPVKISHSSFALFLEHGRTEILNLSNYKFWTNRKKWKEILIFTLSKVSDT